MGSLGIGRLAGAKAGLCFLLAAVFFAASLTPSLMPRDPVMQGLLAGILAAIGYQIGNLAIWLWQFLQLPAGGEDASRIVNRGALSAAGVILVISLWKAADWQNITRAAINQEPIATSAPFTIAAVGFVTFVLISGLVVLFGLVVGRATRWLSRRLPQRIGATIGFAVVAWVFWAAIDGVLVQRALEVADASFEAADTLIEPEIARPSDPSKTGSDQSLVKWEEMGRRGREFVATAPTSAEIGTFHVGEVSEPIRVYVGRRAAETPRERAEIALKELIRVGGFERSVLVVMVPTGTGWMDPGAHDTLEFMLGGDVATVSVQYSYLTSVLSLMTHAEYGIDQARELFNVVYTHWTSLPPAERPRFYVHGLSQGAFNSQATLPVLDLLGDPIDGAMWAGSPFFSRYWAGMRDGRRSGSPAWRPQYGNGSLARALVQSGHNQIVEAPWGPIRLVFLNYGSDAIVVFTFDAAYRKPDWLKSPRAPDVSAELGWYPIVTLFQIALDMMISLQVPRYGHYYAAPDYIDAWAEMLDPPGWSRARAAALKNLFQGRDQGN